MTITRTNFHPPRARLNSPLIEDPTASSLGSRWSKIVSENISHIAQKIASIWERLSNYVQSLLHSCFPSIFNPAEKVPQAPEKTVTIVEEAAPTETSQEERLTFFKTEADKLLSKGIKSDEDAAEFWTLLVDYLRPDPKTKFERYYPTTSVVDTINCRITLDAERVVSTGININPENKEVLEDFFDKLILNVRDNTYAELRTRLSSVHSRALSFSDHEIVRVISQKGQFGSKFALMEAAVRGCVEACACMLISDKKGKEEEQQLTSLSDTERFIRRIQISGLDTIRKTIYSKEQLQQALKDHGSCYAGVMTVGAHAIVIDDITEEGVSIRDPYHGWAIVVTHEAFKKASHSYNLTIVHVL